MLITKHFPKSSNVKFISWNSPATLVRGHAKGELTILYSNGSEYQFADVQKTLIDEMIDNYDQGGSAGKFFNERIRGKFRSLRVTSAADFRDMRESTASGTAVPANESKARDARWALNTAHVVDGLDAIDTSIRELIGGVVAAACEERDARIAELEAKLESLRSLLSK